MKGAPLVLDVPDGGRLLTRAFQDSGFCVVGGPELIFGQDMIGWRPPAGRFDGLIGGPPCQVHSAAANIIGSKAVDLIPEWCEIVKAAHPDWFLMENLRGAPIPSVAGFVATSYLLDRLSLGIPKRRIRRFTFGVKENLRDPDRALRIWIEAMAQVLPKPEWPRRWFRTHPLDPPEAECNVQVALVASDKARGSRLQKCPDRGTEGLTGWVRHELQPALLATDGRSHLRGSNGIYKEPSGITGWLKKTISIEMAWAAMGLPGEPPATLTEKHDKYFTKEGAIRLLGNGVPYDMGRHVARAVCIALGMADPGSIVRTSKESLFGEAER